VEVEGGRVPTADWFLNLQILTSGGFRSAVTAFRVEPVVTHPAPPQTRTCAINAYGSSVTRASALLWHITVLPCMANQMVWTILGMGRI
jgi:hypothetical protein